MELVERYLQAVSFWLPTPDKQDILAELSDDISAQVAELEESLGRKVTEGEIGVLLKGRGRPMFVANAYQPQRYLIGPSLFPAYSLVLKVLVLCYLVPSFVVSLALCLEPWLAGEAGLFHDGSHAINDGPLMDYSARWFWSPSRLSLSHWRGPMPCRACLAAGTPASYHP